MEKEWRELELLVEKIERALSPVGAIIKSPDFIVDNVTGGKREVDISIRFDIGSANILIVIECRNRNGSQDVRWIEEIKTKHTDLGASKVIAVSKNGFTEPATIKAKAHNIELRTFDEISENIIREWNNKILVEVTTLSYKFDSLQFQFDDGYQNAKPIIKLADDPLKTIIVKSIATEYTIESYIDTAKLREIMNSGAKDKIIHFSLDTDGRGTIQTDLGMLNVKEMRIVLSVKIVKEKINTADITRYRDLNSGNIYEFGNYVIKDFNGEDLIISSHVKHKTP